MSEFLHQRNGSDALTVVFSAFKTAGANPKSFTLYEQFSRHPSASDYLFVKDERNLWYACGADGMGGSIEASASMLRSIGSAYKRVRFLGSSMGAYGALLFSRAVPCTEVYAFAPQVFLRSGWPRHDRRIHGAIAVAELPALGYETALPQTTILIGEHEPFDVYQALLLSNRGNVCVRVFAESFHNVFLPLGRFGGVESYLGHILAHGHVNPQSPPGWSLEAFATEVLRRSMRELEADLRLVFEHLYDKRGEAREFESVFDRYRGWSGLRRLLALRQLETGSGDADANVAALTEIAAKAPLIDDIYRPLAVQLARRGKMSEAVQVLGTGIRYNRAITAGYSDLRALNKTLGSAELAALLDGVSKP